MELKEAIEILGAFKLVDIIEILTQGEFENVKVAIDTVLNELNNRIPISEIEKILEAVKRQREKEIKELGMSLRGSAVDILEGIVKNYRK